MTKEKYNLVCIGCPMGCRLSVTKSENGGWLVEGNQCIRGESYAVKELTNPTRVLTTTVKIKNSFLRRLPVRTSDAIPKNILFEAMDIINGAEVEAPIKVGDVIIENLLNTGINIIASRTVSGTVNKL